jgi:hypothetical protein
MEVSVDADISHLCLDIKEQQLHTFQFGRHIPPPRNKSGRNKQRKSGVRDILQDGREMLTEGGLFKKWQQRDTIPNDHDARDPAGMVEAEEFIDDTDFITDSAFDNPNGALHMDIDVSLDMDFESECPFSNV